MRLKQIHGVAVENLPTADGQNFDPAKFKLLLSHRKMELAGGTGQTFPFLPGLNPAALGLREAADSGLDLRYKTIDDDIDEDMSDAGSDKKDNALEASFVYPHHFLGMHDAAHEVIAPDCHSAATPLAHGRINPSFAYV